MAHEAPLEATGCVDVVHGSHALTTFLVAAMRLPAAGHAMPVSLTVTHDTASPVSRPSLLWMRRIGTTCLDTRQFARSGALVEFSRGGTVLFRVTEQRGALLYEATGCEVLRCRVPSRYSPGIHAIVAPVTDGWRVQVTVDWHGHLICRYGGEMRTARHLDLP